MWFFPTLALTTGTDTFITTAGNDTITGASGTVADADSIIDSTTTDIDTANLVVTAKYTPSKIVNVENINVDWNAFGLAHVDAANVSGSSKITLTSSKLGYVGNAQVDNAGSQTIVAGAGVVGDLAVNEATTSVVDAGSAKTVAVNALASKGVSAKVTAGSTTTTVNVGNTGAVNTFATVDVTGGAATTAVNVYGTTGTSDVANVSVVKDSTVSFLTNKVETVNLTAAAGQKVTVGDVSLFDKLTVTSAGAVTLISGSDELTAKTLTNSTTGLTIDLTSDAAADLSKVQATNINLKNNLAGDLTVASGAVLTLGVAQDGTGEIIVGAGTSDTVTLNVTVDQTKVDVLDGTNDIETVTINTALVATDADSVLTFGQLDAKNAVIKGADKVTLTKFNATSIDASAVTKDFTATQDTKAATTLVGSSTATNTVEFTADTFDVSYTGGEGVDKVTMAQTTGNSTVVLGNGANTYTNTTLTNGSAVVIGGTGVDTITVTSTGTDDKTNIVIQSGDGNDVVSLSLTAAAKKETATVDLGAGDDKITIGNATSATDVLSITGGDGTDTVDLNGKDISAGTITLTTVEVLHDSTGASVVDAALIGGKTYTIKGDGALTTLLDVTTATAGSYDFSGLVLDQTLTAGIGGLDITGNAGNDTIIGTSGNDTINAGTGTNTVTGGKGVDSMTSGGTDTFVFALGDSGKTTGTVDSITAFATTFDKIKIGLAGTATNYFDLDSTSSGNATEAATAATAKLDGTVRFVFVNDETGVTDADGWLVADLDGDKAVDMVIQLVGLNTTAEFAFGDIIA